MGQNASRAAPIRKAGCQTVLQRAPKIVFQPYGKTAQTSTNRLLGAVSLFRISALPIPTGYMTLATFPLSA